MVENSLNVFNYRKKINELIKHYIYSNEYHIRSKYQYPQELDYVIQFALH